ncbi:guanine nucleotide exchange factor DBS isoform X2 [Procambarus clarkii]|uniref:guanine nucleotide exchange factor DBS isoform X2 n=1 Tax=Procambarus clarkii TaxID=6728 RepID=UPI001E6746AF|nr:guanine nucleotide exchange factor DBS-like isoform X2 [Procambarus clarkii]
MSWRLWHLLEWLVPERRDPSTTTTTTTHHNPYHSQWASWGRRARAQAPYTTTQRPSRSLYTSPTHDPHRPLDISPLLRRSVSCVDDSNVTPSGPHLKQRSPDPATRVPTLPEQPSPDPGTQASILLNQQADSDTQVGTHLLTPSSDSGTQVDYALNQPSSNLGTLAGTRCNNSSPESSARVETLLNQSIPDPGPQACTVENHPSQPPGTQHADQNIKSPTAVSSENADVGVQSCWGDEDGEVAAAAAESVDQSAVEEVDGTMKVTRAGSRRRSLPGHSSVPGPSRLSFQRRLSIQTTRRSSSKTKINLSANEVMSQNERSQRPENDREKTTAITSERGSPEEDEETGSRETSNVTETEVQLHLNLHLHDSTQVSNLSGASPGYYVTDRCMTFHSDYTAVVRSGGGGAGVSDWAPGCLQDSTSSSDGRFTASTLAMDAASLPPLPTYSSSPALPLAAAAIMSGVSSLRSNLKHKGQVRRRRSDSGHSVTFDLPEDCDNFGGLRERVRDEAEPLSKCMKEQSNRSRQFDGKLELVEPYHLPNDPQEGLGYELDAAGNTIQASEEVATTCSLYGFSERVQTPADTFPDAGAIPTSDIANDDDELTFTMEENPVHGLFSWHQAHDPIINGDFDSNIANNVFDMMENECPQLALDDDVINQSGGQPLTTEEPTPYLDLPPLNSQNPSPLPQYLMASLAWSSADDSGSSGSSTKGPDSGYWGEGTAVGCGRKGVKIVTHGKELQLPYAFLQQGRLKLRIVRDEVLEEGGCALSVRDVSELLHAQYAIITGGKSREGCPILTFPDRGNFAQLADEEYRKLIIYLTSVPSLQDADMGFVLVIDRRNDKWNSVKTVLLKISGFFPGLITVAYVLRPAGFFQKAISEVSNKIFRDEFKFRVVVCNCVGDLHEYIDKNQLTEDLDGCIPYNHDEWIEQRVRRPGYHRFYNEQLFSRQIQHAVATLKQAVEKFSANTQEISASLRAFTQKLQETEFPNDVASTEELLRSQCSEYSVLKDDLLSASRHGETLLNCIKRPGEPRSARLCPDKLINVTAVERLLVQLEETERTFDEFWTRHEGRLTQCLQLRRFETDFRELQTCLEVSLKQLSGMSEVGDSVLHVDQLLAEAQDFHMLTADQLEKAEELRIIGTQLIESQHYAVDSIQPKCVELVRMRDAFHDRITKRLETLHKCRDLQERIERANKWCTEGVELLASQQIERCQAPEFAEEALRELEEFMASSDHSRLGSSRELKTMFEDVITPETKGLVQQVLKRIEDVQMMCEKRKSSLKKLATRLPRPVHAVTPEPAVPFHYTQGQGGSSHPHSHPASPLHADLPKSPKSMRKASTLPKMLRLKPGGQSVKRRPRPATVCLGQDVDFCRPIIEASLRAQQKGVLRRRESFAHGSLRDETAIPSHSSGIYILGPQIIQNLQLLNVHMKQSANLGDSGDSPEWTSDAEAARAKRGHVLRELLDTERIYVSELCSILKGYKDEMLNPEMQPLIPINLYGKSDLLFGNMEEIFRFHNDVFLRDLENCINTPELIGLCFVQRKDSFHRLYSLYCQNKPQSEELRRQVGDSNPFFKECQRRLHHKLPLGAYLLKPVQRITKYQLLLKDLLKCVEGSQGRRELQEAVDTMLTVLKCLNDSMHQVAIVGFPGNLADLGKLLMQGPFSVWNESKKGLRELRLKPAQRHIFLYEKVLLFTKRAGKDTDRATYHFKNALKMSQVGLTESVRGNKGDVRKFEVWLQGRQEVHIILAPSVEVKETWVKEIKRVLLDQFEYLKGENIKQYSSRIQKGASLNGIRIPPLSPTTQHRALRQTASWDMAGNGMSGSGGSISSSSSEGRQGDSSRESGRRSSRMMRSVDATLGDAPEEEEESWSSDYSASDEEEDQETFSESTEYTSSRFLVLADYNAMGGSEVSLREGDYVDLIKVGCAGWWYVRVSGTPYEGWAPAAYLERVLKKGSRSSPSVSSQESSSGLKHATSRSSVASLSAKSEEVNIL